MKNLYLIGGTMGVGKTTVSRVLERLLPDSVFLDGDWCWDSSPFKVTAETKAMVLGNICFMLNSFIRCSEYKNVIFCWVMHEQSIIDSILGGLDTSLCRVVSVSLTCGEAALRTRLGADVSRGVRTPDVIERSAARLPLYDCLRTAKLDVSDISPDEAAERIARL